MNRAALHLLALICLACSQKEPSHSTQEQAMSQQKSDSLPPSEIKGWRGAKWGMTDEEILNLFPGEAKRSAEVSKSKIGYVDVTIPAIQIKSDTFAVSFIMDSVSRKLSHVQFSPVGNCDVSFQVKFSSLDKMLIAKYGKPSFVKDEEPASGKDVRLNHVWSLSFTTIELRYIQLGYDFCIFYLDYGTTDRASLDKL